MTVNAYPLAWPKAFSRTKNREAGRFKTTLAAALRNVNSSLVAFGKDSNKKLEHLVISSNVTLGESTPADSGVSVWFTWDGLEVCIAVDRYSSVQANLQAIHHIVEARRVELRHGTLELVRASFSGFLALPAPTGEHWWDVLQCTRDTAFEIVTQQYRRLAAQYHPDKPTGSHEKMTRLNTAYNAARIAHGLK